MPVHAKTTEVRSPVTLRSGGSRLIKPGSSILFQGDSITDAKRNREIAGANSGPGLGTGYCQEVATRLLRERPQDHLQFYNRGVSGDRIVDLYARWKVDAINLKPDLISILVGVNDTWHEFSRQNGVEVDRYQQVYRMLLQYTQRRLPRSQLILCEPFVAEFGVVTTAWRDEIRQRQQIVKDLAREFGAGFVPFQTAIDRAWQQAAPEHWLTDGVHPTPAGHRVLAECWYDTVAR